MNKILSISVAAYNVEKYLDKLFSMLAISNYVADSVELIIVNDGSKDRTLEVANKYKEKYPNSIVVIDKENGGYGSTINASIKVATGKYYKILDGDDWFDKDNLSGFLQYLDKANEDIIVSPYTIYYEDSDKTELVDGHNIDNLNARQLLMHEITIKTNLYKEYGVKITEHCFYTDTEYALSAMLISKTIAKYQKPIYCYRLGREGQSVSKEGIIKHIDDAERSMYRRVEIYSNYENRQEMAFYDFFASIFRWHYYNLVLAFGDAGVNKIIEFDKYVKNNYPNVYKMSNMSKKIKLMRLTKYKSNKLIKHLFTKKENNS